MANLMNVTELKMGREIDHSEEDSDPCRFPKHEYLLIKFIFISVIGTAVALLGICGNIAIVVVLMQPAMRTANNLYLTVLAVFDTLVLLPAIVLYSMEYVCEFFERDDIYVWWIQLVPYCYAISNFSQTGSVYITVSVTFERYLAVLYPKVAEIQCTRHRAIIIIVGVIGFAAMFNCTKLFEIEVGNHENCTGFASRELVASELLRDQLYATVYSLWLTQFVMVFLPFGILLTFNTAIAWSFKRSLRQLEYVGMPLDRNQLKEQSRGATRVLVTIVVVFLICNCWGFVTTLLESIYGNGALVEWAPGFYTFSREAINFLAIVNSSINFLICWIFGEDFRTELLKVFGCRRRRTRRRRAFIVDRPSSPVLGRLQRTSALTIPGLRLVDRLGGDQNSAIADNDSTNMDPFAALIEAARSIVPHKVRSMSGCQNREAPQNPHTTTGGSVANGHLKSGADNQEFVQDFPPPYPGFLQSLRVDWETTI